MTSHSVRRGHSIMKRGRSVGVLLSEVRSDHGAWDHLEPQTFQTRRRTAAPRQQRRRHRSRQLFSMAARWAHVQTGAGSERGTGSENELLTEYAIKFIVWRSRLHRGFIMAEAGTYLPDGHAASDVTESIVHVAARKLSEIEVVNKPPKRVVAELEA